MFHRIYEAMALGMHPASLYPRRNRDAPVSRRGEMKLRERTLIVPPRLESRMLEMKRLALATMMLLLAASAPRAQASIDWKTVEATRNVGLVTDTGCSIMRAPARRSQAREEPQPQTAERFDASQ